MTTPDVLMIPVAILFLLYFGFAIVVPFVLCVFNVAFVLFVWTPYVIVRGLTHRFLRDK